MIPTDTTTIITSTTATITAIISSTSTADAASYIYCILTMTIVIFCHILTYLSSKPPSNIGTIIRETGHVQ